MPRPNKSHPPNPGKKGPSASNGNNDSTGSSAPKDYPLVPLTGKIEAFIQAYDTSHKDDNSRHKKQLCTQRVIAGFTFLGVLAASIYACITYRLWDDTNNNFRVDERAWVKFEVEASPLRIVDVEGLRIPVRFANTGKTPALNIRSRIVVQILRSDREMPVSDPQQELAFPGMPAARNSYQVTDTGVNHIDSGITFPNDSIQAFVYLIGKSAKGEPVPDVVTEPEIAAMEHNLSYIAVWGQAWYEDIFGKTHWTKFCSSVAPSGPQTRSPKCAHFNDVDR
jgi:hypothetical protein